MDKCYLYVIDIKRNEKGSIDSVYLSDGNSAEWIEKRKIKEQLYIGAWEIDRLYLSKDNKLLERVKDTKISDYEESCKKLGLEPFKIEKMDDDYVILDFPRNMKQAIIPDFVTGVSMNKRIVYKNLESSPQNTNTQKSNLKTETNSSDKSNNEIYSLLNKTNKDLSGLGIELDKKLKDLYFELKDFKEESLSADDRVNKQLEDIDKYLEEIKDKDFSADLAHQLESLREVISENGKTIFELKDSVSETMTNFVNSFDEKLNTFFKKPCGVNDNSLLPKYLRVDDKSSCYLHKEYYDGLEKGYEKYNIKNINLIPFEYLDKLKPLIEYYYNIYTAMDEVFVNINQQHMKELLDFKNGLNVTNEAMELVYNTPVLGYSFKYYKHLSLLIGDSVNFQKYIKYLSNVYDEPNMLLEKFYTDTDVDILTFLVEYRVLSRTTSNGLTGKTGETKFNLPVVKGRFKYDKIIHLIYHNIKDKFSSNFNDEVVKRLALAYIIADKIVNNELNSIIHLVIEPYYKDNFISYFVSDEDAIKYISFLYSIKLHFMYSILIIEGFDLRFIDKVISYLFDNDVDFSLVKFKKDEISNFHFNFYDYKDKIKVTNLYLINEEIYR